MSKGRWKDRCRTTGYSLSHLDRLDGTEYVNVRGELRAEPYSDCDIFNTSSAAAVMGMTNVTRATRYLLYALEVGSAHCYPIRDPEGRLITIIGNTTSLQIAGETIRKANADRQRRGGKVDQYTDVSSAQIYYRP